MGIHSSVEMGVWGGGRGDPPACREDTPLHLGVNVYVIIGDFECGMDPLAVLNDDRYGYGV